MNERFELTLVKVRNASKSVSYRTADYKYKYLIAQNCILYLTAVVKVIYYFIRSS